MLIDGKAIAEKILKGLKARIARLSFKPVFCDILVGSDPVSLAYVKIKGKTAERVGLSFKLSRLPASSSESEIVAEIKKLNAAAHMSGLIVQLPLPPNINRQKVLDAIDPDLDVDALTSANIGNFYHGTPSMIPPTASAIIKILESLPEVNLPKCRFAVVGQGALVGKPLAALLRGRGFNVAVADKKTKDLSDITKAADIVIAGAGQSNIITAELIKPGAVVIDAGTSEMNGGMVGDVDFDSVSKIAKYITPVPGGVGPVTVAMLLANVVMVAERK